MKITVLRKTEYGGYSIYVMHFEYIFQYLIPIGNNIFQDHITLKPGLMKRILWRLGVSSSPYSQRQIEEAEGLILSGATKTIDEFNSPEYKAKRREKIRQMKNSRDEMRKIKEMKGCVWQAREGKDDKFYYHCLTHDIVVAMKEGEAPHHN